MPSLLRKRRPGDGGGRRHSESPTALPWTVIFPIPDSNITSMAQAGVGDNDGGAFDILCTSLKTPPSNSLCKFRKKRLGNTLVSFLKVYSALKNDAVVSFYLG